MFKQTRTNDSENIVLEELVDVTDKDHGNPAEVQVLDRDEMYSQSIVTNSITMLPPEAPQGLGNDTDSMLVNTSDLATQASQGQKPQDEFSPCDTSTQVPFIPEFTSARGVFGNPGEEDLNSTSQATLGDPSWHLSNMSPQAARDESGSLPIYAFDSVFSLHAEENDWQTTFPSAETFLSECFLGLEEHHPAPAASFPISNGGRWDPFSVQGGSSAASSEYDTSTPSTLILPDKDLDQWPIAHCTPHSGRKNPSPGQNHFSVRQFYTDTTTWSFAVERYRDTCFEPHERIENVDLTDETRDWLLIVAQHFVRLQSELQESQKLSEGLETRPRGSEDSLERFFLLPPKTPLQKYLDIYLTTFEPFVPMIPALSLNPNKLASRSSERKSTLLLLLMIAFGSMIDPAPRARAFSHKLTEICWYSLKHLTNGINHAKQDNLTLHCSLLFAIQACFSGRRSHMEAGAAHYHLCLAMMKGSGQFQDQRFQNNRQPDRQISLEQQWRNWIDNEIVSRLLYNWVIADQEISLFYDTAPVLLPSELKAVLPADESVWMAPNAQEWRSALDTTERGGKTHTKISLCELFSLFSDRNLEGLPRRLTLMEVRLLLHPLHSLVFNYRQVIGILGSRPGCSAGSGRARPHSSSSDTFSDIHHLIRHWFAVYNAVNIRGTRLATVSRAVVMQYHVISINLLCSVKQFEGFARRESPEMTADLASEIQEEIGKHIPELLAHCGQILRHTYETDVKLRPIWWSLAVYRASLVLWVFSITRRLQHAKLGRACLMLGPMVSLDAVCFSDPSISQYILYGQGQPQLAAVKGKPVGLERPRQVLERCIEAFGPGPRQWRLARALQCKLERLSQVWDDVHNLVEESH